MAKLEISSPRNLQEVYLLHFSASVEPLCKLFRHSLSSSIYFLRRLIATRAFIRMQVYPHLPGCSSAEGIFSFTKMLLHTSVCICFSAKWIKTSADQSLYYELRVGKVSFGTTYKTSNSFQQRKLGNQSHFKCYSDQKDVIHPHFLQCRNEKQNM